MTHQEVFWCHGATQAQSLRRTAPLTWSSPGGAWSTFLVHIRRMLHARTDVCRCTVTQQLLAFTLHTCNDNFEIFEILNGNNVDAVSALKKCNFVSDPNKLQPFAAFGALKLRFCWSSAALNATPLSSLLIRSFSHFVLYFHRFSVFSAPAAKGQRHRPHEGR